MDRLTHWVSGLVEEALGEGQGRPSFAQLRLWTPEFVSNIFEQWHVDGGNLNAILPLKGTGTDILGIAPWFENVYEYSKVIGAGWEERLGKNEFKRVPLGQLWVFSGTSGERPTVHRSPHVKEERLILVIRFAGRGKR